jgi:hypothetical protein
MRVLDRVSLECDCERARSNARGMLYGNEEKPHLRMRVEAHKTLLGGPTFSLCVVVRGLGL